MRPAGGSADGTRGLHAVALAARTGGRSVEDRGVIAATGFIRNRATGPASGGLTARAPVRKGVKGLSLEARTRPVKVLAALVGAIFPYAV